MVSVLFVCLGNICRSPLAEALFMQKTSMKGLSAQYDADSCGTSRYNIGDSPDPRTLRNAASHGIRISHRARQLLKSDLEHFDHVLVMDAENMRSALSFSEVGGHDVTS